MQKNATRACLCLLNAENNKNNNKKKKPAGFFWRTCKLAGLQTGSPFDGAPGFAGVRLIALYRSCWAGFEAISEFN